MAPTPTPAGALDELARDDTSRKRFLRMMGGGGAAAGLAVLLAACGGGDEPEPSSTTGNGTAASGGGGSGRCKANRGDIEIVNYALTLEYIEARYYVESAESGMVKNRRTLDLLKEFGETEQEHVEALKATVKELGGRPVKAPKTAFAPVIEAGEESIVMIAATVENLGAAAYLGQAPRIKSKEVLAAALAIHTVEARHAAALNQIVGRGFKGGGGLEGTVPNGAFAKPMSMRQVLKTAQPFLAT